MARAARAATATATAITDWPYRMRDLVKRSGLPRQVIHFYIQSGLVPEGHKTGRNMAYYSEEHVERIAQVRRLQHDRFLPLKAIRAIFDETEHTFSPEQRQLLVEVKARLAPTLAGHTKSGHILAEPVLARAQVSCDELYQMSHVGVLGVVEDADGQPHIAEDDAWILELFGEMRRAGFTEALGFSASDVGIFEEVVSTLFRRETALIAARLGSLPADRLAQMVERSLPLINSFLARFHTMKVRQFFSAIDEK